MSEQLTQLLSASKEEEKCDDETFFTAKDCYDELLSLNDKLVT